MQLIDTPTTKGVMLQVVEILKSKHKERFFMLDYSADGGLTFSLDNVAIVKESLRDGKFLVLRIPGDKEPRAAAADLSLQRPAGAGAHPDLRVGLSLRTVPGGALRPVHRRGENQNQARQ